MAVIAIAPGETIKEQLEDKGMTTLAFAGLMGMTEEDTRKLLCGDMVLTHDIAEKLEEVLGVPAGFWNKLEGIYREKLEMK